LTIGLLGATTGISSADTTTPPSDSGTTATATSPDPDKPVVDPTTPSAEPTITYELPTPHLRSGVSRATKAIRAHHQLQLRAVERVVHNQLGKPYAYGGAGPRVFDCSGLVRFVYGKAVGRWLPHNAAAQYHSVHHLKKHSLEVGDLVFQGGNNPFHVGIYAGHGKWWHAPHSGARVRLQKIYRGHLVYGRVLTHQMAKHHKH
jgi:cell wall-associated NlpC family hydrolase